MEKVKIEKRKQNQKLERWKMAIQTKMKKLKKGKRKQNQKNRKTWKYQFKKN